jgi:hypothetical protein
MQWSKRHDYDKNPREYWGEQLLSQSIFCQYLPDIVGSSGLSRRRRVSSLKHFPLPRVPFRWAATDEGLGNLFDRRLGRGVPRARQRGIEETFVLRRSEPLATRALRLDQVEQQLARVAVEKPLAAQPVERPAYRLCHPLYPDECGAARRRGQCHPRLRRGSPSAFHVGAVAEPRPRPEIRGTSPHHHRVPRPDPLSRHRRRQLQRAEGAGPTRLAPEPARASSVAEG